MPKVDLKLEHVVLVQNFGLTELKQELDPRTVRNSLFGIEVGLFHIY